MLGEGTETGRSAMGRENRMMRRSGGGIGEEVDAMVIWYLELRGW